MTSLVKEKHIDDCKHYDQSLDVAIYFQVKFSCINGTDTVFRVDFFRDTSFEATVTAHTTSQEPLVEKNTLMILLVEEKTI